MAQIFLTADDLGLCPAVDGAIADGGLTNQLFSTSLFATSPRLRESVNLVRERSPNLSIGLHFNLTSGPCASDPTSIPLLAGQDGRFRLGFTRLILQLLSNRDVFLRQVQIELNSQISALLSTGVEISHIDGHRHVHLIPGIVAVVKATASIQRIEKIRIINESLWTSIWIGRRFDFFFNGGLLKFIVLRAFSAMSGIKSNHRFFSILYSCRIDSKMLKRLRNYSSDSSFEVMLHPSYVPSSSDIAALESFDPSERSHLLSRWRTTERIAMETGLQS